MPCLLVLDANIAALALPAIQRSFEVDPSQAQWLISSYALSLGGFLLLGGRLADAWDRRLVLCGGLAISAAASLGAAVSPSLVALIGARAVQGLGGAFAFPAALGSLTGELDARSQRSRVPGLFAAASSVGFFAATLVGGALIQAGGWRAGFLITPPAAAVAAGVVWSSSAGPTHAANRASAGRTTLVEVLVVVAAAAAIVQGLTSTAREGWAPIGIGSLLVGLSLAGVAKRLVGTRRTTLLPRAVVARRAVRRSASAAGATVASGVGTMLLLSVYLQEEQQLSPRRTGLVLAGVGLAGIFAAAVLRGGARRARPWPLAADILVQTTGILLVASGVAMSCIPLIVAAAAVFGAGHFAATARLAELVSAGLPPDHHGAAAAILQTAQQFGAAAGVAILSSFATCRAGCASGFLVAALMAAAASVIAIRIDLR